MVSHRYIGMELRRLHIRIMRKAHEMPPDMRGHPRGTAPDGCPSSDYFTMMHGQVVTFLFLNRDRDVFQRDIEQEFDIRRPTATKILQSMERNGLITRCEVDYDARLKKVLLTEAALGMYGAMVERFETFEHILSNGLTEEEISLFLHVIDKIKRNLNESFRE